MRVFLVLLAVVLMGLAAGQAIDIDAAISQYLSVGEEYSTLEIVMQSNNGVQLSDTLVIIRGTPVFIIAGNGELVEDDAVILSVSRDYVESRPSGSELVSVESIADSISAETRRRKEKAVVNQASNEAGAKVELLKAKVQRAKTFLPSVGFGLVEDELTNFEYLAQDIGTSNSGEVVELNSTFHEDIATLNEFIISLDRNAETLGQLVNLTAESRKVLNDKVVKVGRNVPEVVESERELGEVETLLAGELEKVDSLEPINSELVNGLLTRSEALQGKLGEISGSNSDLASTTLPLLVIAAIIAGVVMYFKKLREKQKKEDGEMPPEAAPRT